jgi:hypothetical protein
MLSADEVQAIRSYRKSKERKHWLDKGFLWGAGIALAIMSVLEIGFRVLG